jgi:hypothetical protein
MVWPSLVTPGQRILASDFNTIITSFSSWADSINSVLTVQGGAPSFSAGATFAGSVTFAVAPVFTDAAGTRTALGLPALSNIPTLSGANVFAGATTFNALVTLGAGLNLNGQTISGTATFSGAITFSGNVAVNGTPTFSGGAAFVARPSNYTANGAIWAMYVTNPSGTDQFSFGQSGANYNVSGPIAWIGNGNAFIYYNNAQDFRIGSGLGATPVVTFKGAGRILLGTLTDNGTDLLQVAGTSYFNASVTFTSSAAVTFNGSVSFTQPFSTSGGVISMTRPAAYANSGASWTLNIANSANTDNLAIGQSGASYTVSGPVGWVGNSNAYLYFNSGQDFRIGAGVGSAPIICVKGAGRVLIGTATDDGSNLLQINGGVKFGDATNITFASNWQSWTPTVTGSGNMAIASLVINDAQYLRIGPLVFFKLYLSFSLSGAFVSGDAPSATLPIAAVGNVSTAAMMIRPNGSNWMPGYCLLNPTGNTVRFALYNEALLSVGTISIICEGFYRVA